MSKKIQLTFRQVEMLCAFEVNFLQSAFINWKEEDDRTLRLCLKSFLTGICTENKTLDGKANDLFDFLRGVPLDSGLFERFQMVMQDMAPKAVAEVNRRIELANRKEASDE